MCNSGVSSQVDCAVKIRNLESKLDSVVCTIKDREELAKHVPMPSEVVVDYDKAASLWSLHEQIKQMEQTVEEAARSSSRRSKWQFMGARDAGAKEELRQVYGVSERTESDGAANLIQKLRAINYALSELGQWCAYKVSWFHNWGGYIAFGSNSYPCFFYSINLVLKMFFLIKHYLYHMHFLGDLIHVLFLWCF